MRKLYAKFKDIIPYLFFGVCTTLVNIAAYWVLSHLFSLGVTPSTIIAWVVAVLFAYLTNRKWVFHSEAKSFKEIFKEITMFFVCRLATGFLDWLIMFVFVEKLNFNDMIFKILANGIVIVLNYVASKLLIFAKKKKLKNLD